MSIWFIILVTVLADGTATVETKYPNKPEYNDEKTCNEVGNVFMQQEQMKVGSNNGTVYFICKEISAQDQRNATSKGNGA